MRTKELTIFDVDAPVGTDLAVSSPTAKRWKLRRLSLTLCLGRPKQNGEPDEQYTVTAYDYDDNGNERKTCATINYRGAHSTDFGLKFGELMQFIGNVVDDPTVKELAVELLPDRNTAKEKYLGRLVALNGSSGYQWTWSNN